MRKIKGKKIGIVVGVLILFLAIPVATTLAQLSLKGDPGIECVSSKLLLQRKE